MLEIFGTSCGGKRKKKEEAFLSLSLSFSFSFLFFDIFSGLTL